MVSLIGKLTKNPVVREQMNGSFEFFAAGPRTRKLLERLFKRYRWYYLLLAQTQRKQGDDHGAFRTLMLGQRHIVNEYRFHIKLSELYRDNGDVMAAHTHLRVAEVLKSGYSTIRRLTFETDHAMYADGSETMARVLALPPQLVHRHIAMLNRISIHYPEHARALASAREELKQNLLRDPCANHRSLSSAVDTAISNRWLEVAREISRNRTGELNPTTLALLNRLQKDLGEHSLMLELAWKNEVSDDLTGLERGIAVAVEEGEKDTGRVVELFIPTPFFASPDQEKPTYETIRRMFVQVIGFLQDRHDLIIVPRLQLYWKQCVPKTNNGRVISYHTSAPADHRRLHIQESPLAGRCSFDGSGFAGYSSIATEHAPISGFLRDVSEDALKENQREMHERYVSANVSKYLQPSHCTPISGTYVFVALQIPTDIVSRLAWVSGTDLLKTVAAHYRGTGVKVVVKRHPFCGSMGVQKCLDELEAAGDIVRTGDSIHSIISNAKLVLTVNSGVGLEALIQGKTVVVSGACDYSYAATTVRSPEELREVLSTDPVSDSRRIQELLYFYNHRFTLPAADTDGIHARLAEWLDGGAI
ncbi:MAG: capsule biosynthesis protein [Verrucomicrobiota bacterium]